MSKKKIFLYIVLAVLTAVTMGTLFAWSFTQYNLLLYIFFGLAAVFLAYFILLSHINSRTGWKDEKTLRGRLNSDEQFLVHLYPYKGERYILALYETEDGDAFRAWVRQITSDEVNADAFDREYIGFVKFTADDLQNVKNKCIVAEEDTLSALREMEALGGFFENNTFLAV